VSLKGRQEPCDLPPRSRHPEVPIWGSPDRVAAPHILGKALGMTWGPLRTPVEKYRTERRTTLPPPPGRLADLAVESLKPSVDEALAAELSPLMMALQQPRVTAAANRSY